MFKQFETMIGDRKLIVETGKYAEQAGGSCLVRCGGTAVLVCATVAKAPRDGVDFLPLSIEFEEKLYSVGKIPGGFIKREGRPSEKAILTDRLIDRPLCSPTSWPCWAPPSPCPSPKRPSWAPRAPWPWALWTGSTS